MKKLFLLGLILMSNEIVNAQESAVKVNPFALLSGSDLISYERAFNDNSSGIIGVGFGGYNFAGAKYSNTGAELQYRYYFEEVLKGWYAGGLGAFTVGTVQIEGIVNSDELNFSSIRVGAKGGHQWIWNSGFLLDLNLGLAYTKFNYEITNNSLGALKGSGILPSFSIAIGYSF